MNRDLLIEIMADFENDLDHHPDNPFDPESEDMSLAFINRWVEPFLLGAAIPATIQYLHPESRLSDGVHAGAIAGILQGLWVGYEYARRDNERT